MGVENLISPMNPTPGQDLSPSPGKPVYQILSRDKTQSLTMSAYE